MHTDPPTRDTSKSRWVRCHHDIEVARISINPQRARASLFCVCVCVAVSDTANRARERIYGARCSPSPSGVHSRRALPRAQIQSDPRPHSDRCDVNPASSQVGKSFRARDSSFRGQCIYSKPAKLSVSQAMSRLHHSFKHTHRQPGDVEAASQPIKHPQTGRSRLRGTTERKGSDNTTNTQASPCVCPLK